MWTGNGFVFRLIRLKYGGKIIEFRENLICEVGSEDWWDLSVPAQGDVFFGVGMCLECGVALETAGNHSEPELCL